MRLPILPLLLAGLAAHPAGAQILDVTIDPVDFDRWVYPFNGTEGIRNAAPTFGAVDDPDFDDKDGQLVIAVDTAAAGIPTGLGPETYADISVRVTATHSSPTFSYDPSYDSYQTYLPTGHPDFVADSDAGRPIEIYGVGFRNGFLPPLSFGGIDPGTPEFEEREQHCDAPPCVPCTPPFDIFEVCGEGVRNVYAMGFGTPDAEDDVSNNVTRGALPGTGFEVTPWAIGTSTSGLSPGDPVPTGAEDVNAGETFEFVIDTSDPDVEDYLQDGLNTGVLEFAIVSMHAAVMGQSGANPNFYTREAVFGDSAAIPPTVEISVDLPEPGAAAGLLAGALGLAALHRRRFGSAGAAGPGQGARSRDRAPVRIRGSAAG